MSPFINLSLARYRDALPAHHRLWVRVALLFGMVAYGTVTLTRLIQGESPQFAEVAMLLVCLGAYGIEARYSNVATCAALGGTWLEILHAIAVGPHGIRDGGTIGLTLLLVCFALLLGAPWAWGMMTASCILMPLILVLGSRSWGGRGLPAEDVDYLILSEVSLVGITILLTIFLQALAHVVHRERENAERWKQFVEHAPDAIIAVDRDGTVVAFNQLAELYLGILREKIIGRSLESLRSEYPAYFPDHSSNGGSGPRRLKTSTRTLEIRSQVQTVGSKETDWLFVLSDVTERVATERNARALETQLNHIQKMDAIGQLAGGVAHDFNNLLTAVSGAAYALRDAEKDETAEIATELLEASEHGASLTRQLLTFARREVVQEEVLDLGWAIENSETLIARVLGERIRLDIDTEPGCTVMLDEGQLKQVLLNFAANARDAITGHGTFTLRVRSAGPRVLLEASDTGSGMDEATLEHLFEPFFTTKGTSHGTGLGLSTIHGIVNQWGGSIQVRSVLGRGTSFTIDWPSCQEDVTATHRISELDRKAPTRASVLLVEDNAPARRFVKRVLDRAGYSVTEASSAEDALALCHEGTHPDLVITDVIMPGLTGVDLATRLHQRWHHLPVLFISGYVDDVLADWPYDAGLDLLLKPFSAESLLGRIEIKLQGKKKRTRTRVNTQH